MTPSDGQVVPRPPDRGNTLAAEDRQMEEMRRRWHDWAIWRRARTFHAWHKPSDKTVVAGSLDSLEREIRAARGLPPPGEL